MPHKKEINIQSFALDRKKSLLKAFAIIVFFFSIAFMTGMFLSREMAELGLWIMPALSHLYPLVIIAFVIIYSIIASKRILWIPLFSLLGIGLFLECFLFWLTKLFVFESPSIMALFVFAQIVLVYTFTLVLYFYFSLRIPSKKT
jgi:hypothetical protein